MGYYMYRYRCDGCDREWNSFFNSVNMTAGATDCGACQKPGRKVANDWKTTDGRWHSELSVAVASHQDKGRAYTVETAPKHDGNQTETH
jgi:hypothetical protein